MRKSNFELDGTYTHYLETYTGEEVELTVYFDFQPEERMTWDYPGCPAQAEVTEVLVEATGAEVCLLQEEAELVEEAALNEHYYHTGRR
jgi:hypothetical protein